MSNIKKYAYLSNAYRATDFADSLFPANSQYNGKGDAFRRAVFHALNSVSIGIDLSQQLGDAHEANVPLGLALEKAKDLFNNAVGRTYSTEREIGQMPQDFILEAMENGELRYLTPLNSEGTIIPGVTELKPTNQ